MSAIPWNRLISLYEREIGRLFLTAGGVTPQSLRELSESAHFRIAARRVAEQMVKGLSTANARTWREAAMMGTRSREIHQALQRELQGTSAGHAVDLIVQNNARLIQSIPRHVAEHITEFGAHAQADGKRAAVVERELRARAAHLTANQIKLIARTEIAKAETAITRARSEEIDVHWYQWATSEDQRVRQSHRNLDKVLVAWDNPPSPEALAGEREYGRYAPGEVFNCRCLALPLVSLDQITWPARVFDGSRIVRMSRAAFSRLAGIQLAA